LPAAGEIRSKPGHGKMRISSMLPSVHNAAKSRKGFPAMNNVNGFWGLLVLIADVWAIVNIFQSSASTGKKVLWTVLVIVLPVLGFLIWLLAGPKSGK
jgi:hypothetical protein